MAEIKYGGVNFKDMAAADLATANAARAGRASAGARGSKQLQDAIAAYKRGGGLQGALGTVNQGLAGVGSQLGRDMQSKRGEAQQNLYNAVNQLGPRPQSSGVLDAGGEAMLKADQAAYDKRKAELIGEADRQTKEYDDRMNAELRSGDLSSEEMRNAIRTEMFADPESGSMIATDQVRSNPLMSGMFGEGGIQSQREAEEANLAKTAYDWNAMDQTAMGTAGANIQRQYGAESGNLARALAGRGFGASDSGIAGQQFSGLQGNVSDRMAQMQQSLAQNRMNVGMQRLGAARQAVNQAQGMAQGAVGDQFNRNMVGIGRGDQQVQQNWQNTFAQSQADERKRQFDKSQEFDWGDVAKAGVVGLGSAIGGPLVGAGLGAILPGSKKAGGKQLGEQ